MLRITRTAATYTVEVHKGYINVDIVYTQKSHPYNSFKVFDNKAQMRAWIDRHEKICKIMKIMDKHTQEMESYGYYGSNPGIPEDDYDEIAEDLIKEFGL